MLSKNTKKVSIELKLTDTGIGIRKNKLEHIFNNFEQAHKETNSSYGGTGLGLAIVKQLVELQGGSIILVVNWEKARLSVLYWILKQLNQILKSRKNRISPMQFLQMKSFKT
jgi:signal transduction histidine kinase